jgi:mevalonate pyrophosphate decarboxylase
MDGGLDAGASSRPSVAGRSASLCVTWPESDVSSGTSMSCWAISSETRMHWVHYAARRRRGEPISTAFVESAVNEIVAKRMNKKQQMRWNRTTVQPFIDVRTAVLNDTLEDAFRRRFLGFRPGNDDRAIAAVA